MSSLFVPIVLAFTQYMFGIYLLQTPELTGSVFASQILIMLSIALFLLNFPLYPRYLRKLFPFADYIVQYLMNVVVFEYTLACIWLPLEYNLLDMPPKLGNILEELMSEYYGDCDTVCDIFHSDYIKMVISCMLSLIILACVLHETEFIDLGLLQCGLTFFVSDATHRLKKKLKEVKKTFCNKSRPSRRKTVHCNDDDDDDDYSSN